MKVILGFLNLSKLAQLKLENYNQRSTADFESVFEEFGIRSGIQNILCSALSMIVFFSCLITSRKESKLEQLNSEN